MIYGIKQKLSMLVPLNPLRAMGFVELLLPPASATRDSPRFVSRNRGAEGKSSSTPGPLLPVPAGGMKVPTSS